MGDFNQNYRPGGERGGSRYGGRGSGGRSFGGRDVRRPAMHRATCAQCGNDCEVPFRPSGDRPIYCSNCFESRRNEDGNSRGSAERNFGRPNFEERRTYSEARDGGGKARGNDIGPLMDQIKSLHIKLDKILNVLEPKVIMPSTPKKEVTDSALKPKVSKSEAVKKKVKEEKVKTEKSLES